MKLFLIDEINTFAPYQVFEGESANSLIFFSDAGLEYVVSFIKDETLDDCENVFQFLIEARSSARSNNDIKVGETIACIAKAFFYHHKDYMLTFVCDISDSRQSARQRLFARWFQKFNQNKYLKFDWQIETEECIFYAYMIGCKEYPYLDNYKDAFGELVSSLQK